MSPSNLGGKTFYLAVRCHRNSDHIIPLKVIEFEKDGTAEVGSHFAFDATCDICKTSQRCHGNEVVVWLGRSQARLSTPIQLSKRCGIFRKAKVKRAPILRCPIPDR